MGDKPRLKIMVVDDDPDVLRVAREKLEIDYDVESVDQAIGLMKRIAEHKPELVLVNERMRGLGADALMDLLRRAPQVSRTSIVLHSNADDATNEALVTQSGVLGFITRNKTGTTLRIDVHTMLRRKGRISGEYPGGGTARMKPGGRSS